MAFAFRIRSLEIFSLADSMFLNADALTALQILRSESHPNAQMQGHDGSKSGAKESLSVYGLFHFLASTPQGRVKLRQIFLRPSLDMAVIQERQQTIAVLLRPDNAQSLEQIAKILKKINNIKKSLTYLRKGIQLPPGRASLKRGVWATLQRFAHKTIELRASIRQISRGNFVPVFRKVRPRSYSRTMPWNSCRYRLSRLSMYET
jgi:DNA mismatch repair protein MSH5